MAIKNRTELKAYFVKNAIPTEGNFADLIDSQVTQVAEGVLKPDRDPFSLVAAPGSDQLRTLRLFTAYPAANPDWFISLKPAQNPADASTNRPGFGITDGSGNTRLFIETGTGRVGIGTNAPAAGLDVATGARVQNNLTVTGAITPSVGNAENRGIQFPADPGTGGGDRAFIRYYVDPGAPGAGIETTRLVIGNNNDPDDRIGLFQFNQERLTVSGGFVGINNTNPGASLDVTATTGTWFGWMEAIRFSHPSHSAIVHPGGKLLFGLHSDRNFYFGDTLNNKYTVTITPGNGGQMGIGTHGAPAHNFHVKSPTPGWQALFENANSSTAVYLAHGGGHGIHVTTSTASTSQYLLDLYNPSQAGARFYVTTSGKVGIGTNTPDHHLHVVGETKTQGITFTAIPTWWHRGGTEAGVVNATNHKALMIVGADHGEGKARWVRMWDTVSVEGNLFVEGTADLGWAKSAPDFGAVLRSGFYEKDNPAGRVPDTSHPWCHMIAVRHSNGGNHHQLQIASSYAENDRLFFRKIARGLTDAARPAWNEIATVTNNALKIGNWTIEASGANLYFKQSGAIVVRMSTEWDRLLVFQNPSAAVAAPYFYFNQQGAFGRYAP